MAALLLFQQACWDPEQLEPGLLVELAALIERERRPSLGWWSGAKILPFTTKRETTTLRSAVPSVQGLGAAAAGAAAPATFGVLASLTMRRTSASSFLAS